jgi:hypothetical protein
LKRITTYYFVALLAVMLSCNNKNSLPSLRETFSKDDKIPFGTYVAYNQLQQLYYRNDIQDEKENFETNWRAIYNSTFDTGALYVCISRNLYLSDNDVASMLEYVSNGNTLFISSQNISQNLLDTLGCSVVNDESDDWQSLTNTSVQMQSSLELDSSTYGYFFLPFKSHFSKYDTSHAEILGVNDSGQPNFILNFYGKGRLYLHCEPRALSNYFLLRKDNYRYLQNLLAFTPPTVEHVFWDDYYNKHNYLHSSNSTFSILFQYPAMGWAFWLLLIALLLYILFGGKRRQRIVPVISPMKNTTVAFTETIGRLYFQKKDNKNMADKMITYFFEQIRNQFFLNTNQINDDFITTLSRKSSVPKETTEELFKTITGIQDKSSISDQELLLLNQQIENFYKNKT